MNFEQFIYLLSEKLTEPLPGESAQLKMASIRRLREIIKISSRDNAIRSSVLILLFPGNNADEFYSVLIQRPSYEGVHGGQISLPGGKVEGHDRDIQTTAKRETQEEIGIDANEITIIGKLSELYIPPSNFLVFPLVGYLPYKPVFRPDPQEVAGIIEIKLNDLVDKRNIKQREITIKNLSKIKAPCFDLEGKTIWGATAMILSEFREILRKIL